MSVQQVHIIIQDQGVNGALKITSLKLYYNFKIKIKMGSIIHIFRQPVRPEWNASFSWV